MKIVVSQDKAQQISNNASARIAQEGLAMTPSNFALWYAYYSGLHPEVVKEVDSHIQKGGRLSDNFCDGLHKRYLTSEAEREFIEDTNRRIQQTLAELTTILTSTGAYQNEYNRGLARAQGELSNATSADVIQKLVGRLMDETSSVIGENKKLETQLNKATLEMEDMRRSMENLKKEVMTDTLTGLPNRKFFESKLETVATNVMDRGGSVALLMVDIDHFKGFNDTFGHQVGDQVLRLVSRALVEGIKGQDTAARYGGEEFVIILPDTKLMNAEKVGNALRERIAAKDIINLTKGEKLGRLTISVGVAEYHAGEPLYAFVERADKALYMAKGSGRNQVVSLKYDENLHRPQPNIDDVLIETRG